MKNVRGYFVLLIKQYDSTMYVTDYHYTPWCIAEEKYCRYNRQDKIKKFDTYSEAEQFRNVLLVSRPQSFSDRQCEIAYLTTPSVFDDSTQLEMLTRFVKVAGEEDALMFDRRQQRAESGIIEAGRVPWWNYKEFDAIYNQ